MSGATIPCGKGGHSCQWPACPQECEGRPGRVFSNDKKITIKVSGWNSGCLPDLLRREIEAVERHIKLRGAEFTAEEHDNTHAYLDQLRACALAVREARL